MTLHGMIMLLFPQVIKWRSNQVRVKKSLLFFPLCHSNEDITNLQVKENNSSQDISPSSVGTANLCHLLGIVNNPNTKHEHGLDL